MDQLIFQKKEEIYGWILNTITGNDERYYPSEDDINTLIYFVYNGAIIISESVIPNIEKPGEAILNKMSGPQKDYKYIAYKILENKNIEKENIKFEYTYGVRKIDLFVQTENKKIFIECGPTYIKKLIEYLEESNSELWLITQGNGPWEDLPPGLNKCQFFIIKRGPVWDKLFYKYLKIKYERIKDIRNCLNLLN